MDKMEKLGASIIFMAFLVVIAMLGLFGWGFVELISWLTSK